MVRAKNAFNGLRYLTYFVMVFGLLAAGYGFLYRMMVPLFLFEVPTWVIGLSAAYMGLRYFRRIPEMERKADLNARFSWKNFSFRRSR